VLGTLLSGKLAIFYSRADGSSSSTGIVNLYNSSKLASASKDKEVEPFKSLEHLTTPITTMAFHPSGELFVSASAAKNDALKLVS